MCGTDGWIGRQEGGEEVADRMRRALHHRALDGYGVELFPSAEIAKPLSRC
jgi:hypothetical protein